MRCCLGREFIELVRMVRGYGVEPPESLCVDVDVALPPGVIVLACFPVPYSRDLHKKDLVGFYLVDGRSTVKVALGLVEADDVKRVVKPGKWVKTTLAALVSNGYLKPARTTQG